MQGFMVGLAIAAPVGPISVLCIGRTLSGGAGSGMASGLGAATADAIYAGAAAFGLTLVCDFFLHQQVFIRAVGGSFLFYLGIRYFFSRPTGGIGSARGGTRWANYASTFLLTLANPPTILFFLALFAGLGIAKDSPGGSAAGLLVAGVFIGSSVWWLILSLFVSLFRKKVTMERMRWTNRFSGLILLGFGFWAIWGMKS
jgi:threonine/homoserine/homoserine lactone efflux protein